MRHNVDVPTVLRYVVEFCVSVCKMALEVGQPQDDLYRCASTKHMQPMFI